MKTRTLVNALSYLVFAGLVGSSVLAQSTSESGRVTLLHAPSGSIGGGGRIASESGGVVAEVSVGDIASGAVSDVTTGGVQVKNNYIGQLYDITGIELESAQATIPEGETSQLNVAFAMDDGTMLGFGAAVLDWTVDAELVEIDADTRVATARPVYKDETTSVAVRLGELESNSLALQISDVDADNYLGYGSDGLDDVWQIGFYGLPPNANASPDFDSDGDGYDNAKEYLLGFSPVDGNDYFQATIALGDEPGLVDLVINRVIPERLYTVKLGSDLKTYPTEVATIDVSTTETGRRIEGISLSGDTTFLRVEVAKP